MSGPAPLKFRNPLLITFLFNFNIIKDGYQKLTFTHFTLLISVFYLLYFKLFIITLILSIFTVHPQICDPVSDCTTT